MAASGTLVKPAVSQLQGTVDELKIAVQRMARCISAADDADLGDGLIQIREVGIDPLEAVFASGLRRFDKAAEYRADGALSAVAWVRERCIIGCCMKRAGRWHGAKTDGSWRSRRRGG